MDTVPFQDPASGRFLPGNRAASTRSTPGEHRMALLRKAALECVTEDDMRRIFRKMVDEAADGNVFAAHFVCDRTLGKVRPAEASAADNAAEIIAQLYHKVMRPPDAPEDAKFRVLDAAG